MSAIVLGAIEIGDKTQAELWGCLFRAFESGLWLMWPLDDECIWIQKPIVVREAQAVNGAHPRLHCETGPAIELPEDQWFYWRGVEVERYVVMEPGKITVSDIETERNAELRRVKMERYGQGRYLVDSGAEEIHRDDWGVLYRKAIAGDESLVMVKVVNATAEPDGSFKDYFLRVHPELRPLLEGNRLGDAQPLTARNGVASTFGLRGEDYEPVLET